MHGLPIMSCVNGMIHEAEGAGKTLAWIQAGALSISQEVGGGQDLTGMDTSSAPPIMSKRRGWEGFKFPPPQS